MKIVVCAVITAAAFVVQTQAATIADCAKIAADTDRLECYDEVAGRVTPDEAAPPPESKWLERREKSELTDDPNVYLAVRGDQRVSCRKYGDPSGVTLWVRCVENTTALVLDTDECHMASSDYHGWGHVDARIDDRKMRKLRMIESTDNSALGLWSGRNSIPFIKQMFGARKLTLRFTPYGENSETVTFDITGLEGAIKPLREACHW